MKNIELTERVTKALDDEGWREWLPLTKSGAIGAVPFLAVILWKVGGTDPDKKKDAQIVDAWARQLVDATARRGAVLGGRGPTRAVIPHNPVTLVELPALPPDWNWLLAINDADSFLESKGMGFTCSGVLEYWHEAASPNTTTHEPGPNTQHVQEKLRRWSVREPKRLTGYGKPLYALLMEACNAGKAKPTAEDVLQAWRTPNTPEEVFEVLPTELKYSNKNGTCKSANKDAIRQSINRLTDD